MYNKELAHATQRKRHCALAFPLHFYSFGKTLQYELERRGYVVHVLSDEYPATILGRILGQLNPPSLLRKLTLRRYKTLLENKEHLDFFLAIKGRGLSAECIAFLKSKADRVIAYNFDSFGFHPSSLDWSNLVDRFFTFDFRDAREHRLDLVHLFSASLPSASTEQKTIDLSVMMKNHSQRLDYADRILRALPNLTHYVYVYEPNKLSFLFNFIRHPFLYSKYWNNIHFRPLSYGDFLKVLASSRTTVDFAHPSQTGITIRCFEALSVGTNILTNNPNVSTCSLFAEAIVEHFDLRDESPKLLDAARRFTTHQTQPRSRTVSEFIDEILECADVSSP